MYMIIEYPTGINCPPGHFYDMSAKFCFYCREGSYSAGGDITSCTPCPDGETLAAGKGKCPEDCIPGEAYFQDKCWNSNVMFEN